MVDPHRIFPLSLSSVLAWPAYFLAPRCLPHRVPPAFLSSQPRFIRSVVIQRLPPAFLSLQPRFAPVSRDPARVSFSVVSAPPAPVRALPAAILPFQQPTRTAPPRIFPAPSLHSPDPHPLPSLPCLLSVHRFVLTRCLPAYLPAVRVLIRQPSPCGILHQMPAIPPFPPRIFPPVVRGTSSGKKTPVTARHFVPHYDLQWPHYRFSNGKKAPGRRGMRHTASHSPMERKLRGPASACPDSRATFSSGKKAPGAAGISPFVPVPLSGVSREVPVGKRLGTLIALSSAVAGGR
jgi:hypothetical protein